MKATLSYLIIKNFTLMKKLLLYFLFLTQSLLAQNCPPPGAIVLDPNVFVSGQSTGLVSNLAFTYPADFIQNTFTGKKIYINGMFAIDDDITFDDCEVFCDANATIQFDNIGFHKLEINNGSHFKACSGFMWTGIVVPMSSSLNTSQVLINSYSLIEDAIIGLNVTEQVAVKINNANFNKNHTDIKFEWITDPVLSEVKNSNFLCKDVNGNNANCLLPPYNGLRKECCIDVVHVVPSANSFTDPHLQFGNYGNGNHFEYSDFGIRAEQSFIEVESSTFKYHHTAISNNFDGAWIVRNSSLSDCDVYGIESSSAVVRCLAENNTLTNITHGIEIRNSHHMMEVIIRENILNEMFRSAIALRDVYRIDEPDLTLVTINYNQIENTNSYLKSRGVVYHNAYPHNNLVVSIDSNNITNLGRGIITSGIANSKTMPHSTALLSGLSIANNSIFITYDPNNSTIFTGGIFCFNSSDLSCRKNIVDADIQNTCNLKSSGIWIENCFNDIINCNTVNHFGKGFCFSQQTYNETFMGNLLGVCYNQFWLDYCLTGLGNVGNLTHSSYNYFQQNYGTGFFCDVADFKTTNGINSNDPNINGQTNIFTDQNFIDYNEMTPFYLQSDVVQITINPPPGYEPCNEIDDGQESTLHEIISDTLITDAFLNWWNDYYAYKILKSNDSLRDSNSEFTSFYNNSVITNLGLIGSLVDSLTNLDTLTSDEYQQLLSQNNSISPLINIEFNFKKTNKIYLKIKHTGYSALSGNDLYWVHAIAGQCPITGGEVVYTMQMIESIIDTTDYDYSEVCSLLSFQRSSSQIMADNENYVYPNPSTGTITVFNKDLKFNSIEIFNNNGSLVFVSNLTKESNFYNLNLAEGFYHVALLNKNGTTQKIKLSIINK